MTGSIGEHIVRVIRKESMKHKPRLNVVTIMGEVLQSEERVNPKSNKTLTVIMVDVDDSYVSSSGEVVSRHIPVEVIYYKSLPEIEPGSCILVNGKLSYSQWTDKNGSQRHKIGIVSIEQPQILMRPGGGPPLEEYPDDIPF